MNSNEPQNPQLNIAAVSSRFSLLMLTSRLLALELQFKEANLTMGQNPNQYTDNEIEMLKPMIEDLRKAVAVLQNGY
jgi:hypothetical protein